MRHIKAAASTHGTNGRVERMVGVNWDVTRTRTLEAELRTLATTDPLTGALNRRSFTEQAAAELARAHRYGTPLSMLSLDIDYFKNINDSYGHQAGDEVLKALVKTCHATLRGTDIFARMGGEEFSAILPETPLEDAWISAERLRVAVEECSVPAREEVVNFTVSVGLSEIRGNEDDLDRLMRQTDRALYRAKEAGRNRVEVDGSNFS